jgi:hypothetical protein
MLACLGDRESIRVAMLLDLLFELECLTCINGAFQRIGFTVHRSAIRRPSLEKIKRLKELLSVSVSSLLHSVQTGSGSCPMGTGSCFLGDKEAGA